MERVCSSQLNMMRMMLKMAAVALLLLCCFVFTSTGSQDKCDYYAVVNQTKITLPLQHEVKDSETLKWKHNDSTIFSRKRETFVLGVMTDVNTNGSLVLKQLKKTNSGKYTPEVHNTNGISVKNFKDMYLCVLDSIAVPSVTTECSKTHVTFSCNIKPPMQNVNYEWLKNKELVKGAKTKTLKQKVEDLQDNSFQCKVSNPAMSKTSVEVKKTCITPTDKLFGIDFWIMVGILAGGGGLVLLLIIMVIVCCIRARRKNSMKVKDEEELRLGWTNPEQQQHHHHHHHRHHDQHNHPSDNLHPHHHHQQQPAGHTGPRQHRTKQHRDPRSKVPDTPGSQPQPSPRRAAQAPRPVDNTDDEQPPPLPQPRKKAPKTRV